MADSKRKTVAQRRTDNRAQMPNTTRSTASREKKNKEKKNITLFIILGSIIAVFVIIFSFVFVNNQQAANFSTGKDQVVQTISSPNPQLLANVEAGNVENILKKVDGTPIKGKEGKPVVFYAGAEYCPFCASMRWPVIIALNRFGEFNQYREVLSGEGAVPSFTFHEVKYSSQYIELQSVELSDNNFPNPKPLETPTLEQEQILNKHNSAGSVPFMSIANRFIIAQTFFQPDSLTGLTYEEINEKLQDGNSDLAREIYGSANYITAAICSSTENKPANVCTSDPIPSLQKTILSSATGHVQEPQSAQASVALRNKKAFYR